MGMMFFFLLICSFGIALGGYIPPGPKYPCPPQPKLLYPCKCTQGSDTGITVICQKSNLASLSIAFSNIAGIQAPVDLLTISNGRFTRLFGGLLYALEVKKLVIEDTPLKKIDPQTFLGVNKTLEEIHLIRTELKEFPTDAFKDLGKVVIVNIDGHHLTTLPVGSMSGLLPNNLEKFSLTHGNLSDLPVETLVPCKKLKRLDLHGNQFKMLKKNQFKTMRSVEMLDLSHNSLIKVDASHVSDLNKLSILNLSNNALTEITRGAFARNTVLRTLILDHNKIKKIDSSSFRGMRFIRRLQMTDNEISEIGRDTFGAISRVGVINLARNKIKKIDFQMFHRLQYVELIDVSDNYVTEIQKLSFKDLYLVHINLSHNAISKIEAGSFENCANITMLDLSYNKIESFHPKVFDDITYATEFQLSYNNITDLSKVPLANMTGLKILNVSNNQISTIPRNTFPKLYELHTIDLSHNNISDIYNGVFQTLFGIRSLNLSHNSMTEIKIGTVGVLSTLFEMDLSYNLIAEISRGAFAKLFSLQTLDLSHNVLKGIFVIPGSLTRLNLSYNEITQIAPRTWPTANALQFLDLSDNWLQDSLESGSFGGLLVLNTLDLSRNFINDPPWAALSDINTLQYLDVQGNNLTTLGREAFGKLPIVFELNLAYNQIRNISQKAFEGVLQLLKLNMSHNEITHIPNGAFHGLVALRTLDLSYNELESLDNKTNGLLDDCLSLETINLSHNKISFVTRKTFPSDPYQPYKIKEVDLSYNVMPAITYDLTYGTKKIVYLNLSHNMINEVRKNILGNLTSLEILDLSYNEIKELSEPNVFKLPLMMKKLYMSNNQLETIPVYEMKKLIEIDLRNNQLDYYTEFQNMIKNGTKILYSGNSVNCDCRLRPLRRFIMEDGFNMNEWKETKCHLPDILGGKSIFDVNEEALSCNGHEYEGEEFDTTPDVKFREISRNPNGKISLTWYVTAKEDIADFALVVKGHQGHKEKPMLKKSLAYNTRSAILTNFPTSQGPLELCILALDSEGKERELHNLQCRSLSSTQNSASLLVPNLLLYITLIIILYR